MAQQFPFVQFLQEVRRLAEAILTAPPGAAFQLVVVILATAIALCAIFLQVRQILIVWAVLEVMRGAGAGV